MAGVSISGHNISTKAEKLISVDGEGRLILSSDSAIQITGPITNLGTDLIPRSLGPFTVTSSPVAIANSQTLAVSVLFFSPRSNTEAVDLRIDSVPVASIFPGMTKTISTGMEATVDLDDYSLVADSGSQTINCVYFYTE